MGTVFSSMQQPKISYISYNHDSNGPCISCSQNTGPGNPGCFEEIHDKVKDLQPQNFEGARLKINKPLSQHFSVAHTLAFSSITPSGYKFGTRYTGTKRVGLYENYPKICGEIMPNGNMTATLMHTLCCRWRIKVATQITTKKYEAFSSTVDYRSNVSTASITLAESNFTEQRGTLVLHYLHALTPRITLGGEMACHFDFKNPKERRKLICLAGRYSTGASTISATVGLAGFHICIHKKASHQLEIGATWKTNFRKEETIAEIIYKLDLPHSDLIFRGLFNSENTIGGAIEKRLRPFDESSLQISALYNIRKENFRVGVGLNVG